MGNRPNGLIQDIAGLLTGRPEYERGSLAPGPNEHRYFYESFEASEAHLEQLLSGLVRGLETVAEACKPETSISVVLGSELAGHEEHEFESIEEVFKLSNTWGERIRRVQIAVKTEVPEAVGIIILHDHNPGYSLALILEGLPYDQLQKMVSQFNRVKDQMVAHPIHSFLSNNRFWYAFYAFWVVGSLLFLSAGLVYGFFKPEPVRVHSGWTTSAEASPPAPIPPPRDESPRITRGDLTRQAVSTLLVLGLLCVARPTVFPKGQFLIGRGVKRADTFKRLRWAVMTVVVLPILWEFTLQYIR